MINHLKKMLHILGVILKPTWLKIGFFTLFTFILLGGIIQSYAFIDDIPGVEKPPFYDLLRPISIWPSYVFFSLPLYVLAELICSAYDFCSMVFQVFPSMGGVKFPVIGLIYTYVVSAWMGYSWSRWIISRRVKLIILLGCFSTLLVTHLPLFLTLLHTLENMSHVISTLILDYFVLLFYIVAVYGIVKESINVLGSKRRLAKIV